MSSKLYSYSTQEEGEATHLPQCLIFIHNKHIGKITAFALSQDFNRHRQSESTGNSIFAGFYLAKHAIIAMFYTEPVGSIKFDNEITTPLGFTGKDSPEQT